MSRRYDSRTTIFSPEGRLYQVEYAMEAISHAGTALGILAVDGIVLAAERKMVSALLEAEQPSQEKIYKVNNSILAAVAGITSDANILVHTARMTVQRHLLALNSDIPVEQLVQRICNVKQGYTQMGGLRPFGVSIIYAGYDAYFGYQLYQSDPSGNYAGWKATTMGSNSAAAQSVLKNDYVEGCSVKEAEYLAVKVLRKTMDATALKGDRIEMVSLSKDEHGKPVMLSMSRAQIDELIKKVVRDEETSGSPASEGVASPRSEPLFSTTVS